MTQEEQIDGIKHLHEVELELLKSKGSDYANEDVLANFKQVSEVCRLLNIDSRTLYGTHLFYIILKVQRICNLLSSEKEPKNESIADTLVDLRNYIALLACSIVEVQSGEEEFK